MAGPATPLTAQDYLERWNTLPPARALAILKQSTANLTPEALREVVRDPRIQALREIALPKGTQFAAPTRQQRAEAEVARQRAEPSPIPRDLRDVGMATVAGINSGLFGLPARAAAAITGNSNAYAQEFNDAEGRRAPLSNFLAMLGTAVLGSKGIGGGVAAGGTRLAASTAPAAARAGNILQGAATLRKGQGVRNVAKIAGAGAAAGAAQGVGEGRNVGEYAALGAVAAPALAGAVKVGRGGFNFLQNVTGFEPIGRAIGRHISTPPEEITRRIAERQAQGLNSSIYEVLPLQDRKALDGAIARMPAKARERLSTAVRERAENIVTETADSVRRIVRPTGPDATRSRIAADLARSRGPGNLPEAADMALAERAGRSPLDMREVRRVEANNIMQPHDNVQVAETINGLLPTTMRRAENGTVIEDISDPDIAQAIRQAAGPARRAGSPVGITVADVTGKNGLMANIRGNANLPAGVRDRALAHLEGVLDDVSPEVGAAARRMSAAYAGRSRMAEGVAEGAQTRRRVDVPAESGNAARRARNAYDTPEGAAGRALGQGQQLERDLLTSPAQALRSMNRISTDPTAQRAISENLGNDAGENIANVARMQTQSVRRLAGLDKESVEAGSDNVHLLQNLMMLGPTTLPVTKIRAVGNLIEGTLRIPNKQANAMVDMLFSQNPTQISRAVNFIAKFGDLGDRILRNIGADLSAGQMATRLADGGDPQSEEDAGGEPDYSQMSDEELMAQVGGGGEGDADFSQMSDEELMAHIGEDGQAVGGDSPYADDLQQIYDTESPELLDLIDRVSNQESGGQQFGPDGQPLESDAGAIGVMQVMPGTAPEAAALAGVPFDENAYRTDPTYNKLIGIAYLSEMLRRYDGDVELALAAYNAGPGRADQYASGQNGLPAETQDYVARIM